MLFFNRKDVLLREWTELVPPETMEVVDKGVVVVVVVEY